MDFEDILLDFRGNCSDFKMHFQGFGVSGLCSRSRGSQ